IQSRQVGRPIRQSLGEQTRPARELQHITNGVEGIDGRLQASRLLEPSRVPLGSEVVPASAEPDVLVLGRAVLVVPGLLVQDPFALVRQRAPRSYVGGLPRRRRGSPPSGTDAVLGDRPDVGALRALLALGHLVLDLLVLLEALVAITGDA